MYENHKTRAFEINSSIPTTLNLFISNYCNYKCSFPDRIYSWCHSCNKNKKNKGLLNVNLIHRLLKQFKKILSVRSLKIAGMEPSLHPNLSQFVEIAKDLGFKDISLTSNGSRLLEHFPKLIEAGLKRITISIHSLNKNLYSEITRNGKLENVLRVIESALDFEIKISINRVLLKGINDDLTAFFDYCQKFGLTAKLYQLLWFPGI
ncbi:MAG: radical SAM protein, partial [Candidatus Helarchaeota archaeon]